MKKIIIGLIVGLMCVVGSVTTGIVVNTPEYVFSKSLSNAFEEVLERDDLETIIDVFEQGSIDLDYEMIDERSLGGKVYFGLDDNKIYFEDVYFKDFTDGTNINGNIYLSDELVYIENDKYLNGAYGIKLDNLSEQFKNSIFYKDSKYTLDDEYKNVIDALLDYYDNDYQDLQKDQKKLIDKYLKQAVKLLKEHGEFESETRKVILNDESGSYRVVTLELDQDSIASILEALAQYIIDDKELKEFIDVHVENLQELMSIFEIQSGYSGDIYDEIIDGLKSFIDENNIRKMDFKLSIDITTPKLSNKLLKLKMIIEDESSESSIAFDFGSKGVKDSDCIELHVDNAKICSYTVKEDSRNKFNAKFSTYVNDEEVGNIEYILDKKADTFNINIKLSKNESIEITGNAIISGDAITFEPTKIVKKYIENEYDLLDDINVKLTISTDDKMPKPNKNFNNFLKISEETLDELIEKIDSSYYKFKIGSTGPLSGSASIYGQAVKKGIELAIVEINKEGIKIGNETFTFELTEFINDENSGDKAVAGFRSLFFDEGVDVFIGATTSGVTSSLISVAGNKEIPVIIPTATDDLLTTGGNYRDNIFRACFYDSYQGSFMAEYAAKNGKKTAYVLYSMFDGYSIKLKDAFVAKARELGMKVTINGYPGFTTDFTSIVAPIVNGNYDCVYLPDYYENVDNILFTLYGAGYEGTTYGSDGWDGLISQVQSNQDQDIAFLEKCFYTNHFFSNSNNQAVKDFVAAYKAKYNEAPSVFAALAYDSVYMLKQAIEQAQSKDYEAIIKALNETTYTRLVTSKSDFKFDENGDPLKDCYIITYKDGKEVEAN